MSFPDFDALVVESLPDVQSILATDRASEGREQVSEAQKRFNEAINEIDRAYWQGAIDGEESGKESVINILKKLINHDDLRYYYFGLAGDAFNLDGGFHMIINLIEGRTSG